MAEPKRPNPSTGIAVLVLLATVLVGVFSLFYMDEIPRESKPLCLVAAAIAFGFTSNALWRR
jgi:hypothetical protein